MASARLMGLAAGAGLALGACTPDPVPGTFTETGELIALSGGDAGPEAACHTCHGLNGEGNGGDAPRLAGLDPGYLARQLTFFADGMRNHPQMSWIAKHLSTGERVEVSAYYAAMAWAPDQGEPSVDLTCGDPGAMRLYHSGDPERGLQPCAICHGDDGEGAGLGNPAIAGQPAPYVAAQLRQWRNGERYGDALGAMRRPSRQLAEAEINPLADYVSRMMGPSDRPEFPEECLPPRRPDPRNDA